MSNSVAFLFMLPVRVIMLVIIGVVCLIIELTRLIESFMIPLLHNRFGIKAKGGYPNAVKRARKNETAIAEYMEGIYPKWFFMYTEGLRTPVEKWSVEPSMKEEQEQERTVVTNPAGTSVCVIEPVV